MPNTNPILNEIASISYLSLKIEQTIKRRKFIVKGLIREPMKFGKGMLRRDKSIFICQPDHLLKHNENWA